MTDCLSHEFKCGDFDCIDGSKWCDGHVDCGGFSEWYGRDEQDCGRILQNILAPRNM